MAKAEETRRIILQKAFELIYTGGYQATSIDHIIASTQVTKGAFFYHFKNKDEMGLAVIREIMFPALNEGFVQTLKNSSDPVKDIYAMTRVLLYDATFMSVTYGCPAANLTQEMSPINPAFREALAELLHAWQLVIEQSVKNGKKAGNIRKNISARQVAYFVMSGYWGIRNLGKLHNSDHCYSIYLKELKDYLRSLQ